MWFRPLFSGRLLCDLFSPQRHKAHNGLKYIGSGFRVSGSPLAVSKKFKIRSAFGGQVLAHLWRVGRWMFDVFFHHEITKEQNHEKLL